MANVLNTDKQVAVISALAEGSSIRSIERITGIHRDTIMRLGVRVGKGCEMLLDSKMQDLGCRYLQFDSAPSFASAIRRPITGNPEMELVSTSHIERLNATTRLHVKRLSRLTLAFSKKLENFEAAVALHFAYYNFVKRHNTIRCTPAMAAGIERDFWTVGDLVEATA
jgi:IS1 family transposase